MVHGMCPSVHTNSLGKHRETEFFLLKLIEMSRVKRIMQLEILCNLKLSLEAETGGRS